MGLIITGLMALAYAITISSHGLADVLQLANHAAGMDMGSGDYDSSTFAYTAAATVFAFGLVAFGFLGMGPVTIAVDSYGPVTDNAQSVYELSMIESKEGISDEIEKEFKFKPNFEKAKAFLEENDGAGNTFKATAKPVLIGTAVVGATTMIFALDRAQHRTTSSPPTVSHLSMIHPPFFLGLISGGAVIYWFHRRVDAGRVDGRVSRAVEYIKANIKLDTATGTERRRRSRTSNKVVEICTALRAARAWQHLHGGVLHRRSASRASTPSATSSGT